MDFKEFIEKLEKLLLYREVVREKENLIGLLFDKTLPYYTSENNGHGYGHIADVLALALNINERLKLNIDTEEIIIASMMHDMFSILDRDNHHERARDFVMGCGFGFLSKLSPESLLNIANAVGEHRASWKGGFSSPLSELISSADRGYPDFEKIVRRIEMCATSSECLVFRIDVEGVPDLDLPNGVKLVDLYNNLILSQGDAKAKTITHLYEKYSRVGYANYPNMYKNYMKNELEMFYSDIDKFVVDIYESVKV